MSRFATVHAEFLFEAVFPFFRRELSLSEGGSTAMSSKLTVSTSYSYFCSGFFFFNCSNLRGKTTSSVASSGGGIGLWCEHAEGTIQILSFIDKVWECGWLV